MTTIKLVPCQNPFSYEWEYELVEDAVFLVDAQRVLVPSGFSYDGATIPAAAWLAIYSPFDPIVMEPALLHDWLYTTHQVPREMADDCLANGLRLNDVPKVKVHAIRTALRIFGGHHWEHTAADLAYNIDWLKKELIADGRDPATYHLP